MQQPTAANMLPQTIADDLDRLDVIAHNIGTISHENATSLLIGLDAAYQKLQDLDPGTQSYRIADTQFKMILSKLRADAVQFIRDFGGVQKLQQARQRINPPLEHEWWYIDDYVTATRKARNKRYLITGGIVLGVLALLIVVYQQFFAPDPQTVALYTHEQSAVDRLLAGDLDAAMQEVDKGLAVDPEEPTFLIMRGVILELRGSLEEADEAFATSRRVIGNDTGFFITRGQAYTYVNQAEKALADAQQAAELDPQSAQAFMLSGMAHEMLGSPADALDDYQKAYEAAEQTNSLELAALARTRIAFLVQGSSGQMIDPIMQPTEQP